jgi:hypothetical protein
MTMRRLFNIAMPFMRESHEADYASGRTPKSAALAVHGKVLYGLPCARCGAYYPAELSTCPVCSSTEKALPTPRSRPWPVSVPRPETQKVPLQENADVLARINRDLLANQVQPMTLFTATEARAALA